MTIKELLEKRAGIFEKSKEILDKADKEKRGLTAEENGQVKAMYGEIDSLKAEIETRERGEQEEKDLRARAEAEEKALGQTRGRKTATTVGTDAPDGQSPEDMDLALRGWALGAGRATQEMLEATQRVGLNIAGKELHINFRRRNDADGKERVEVRSMSVGGREIRALAEGNTSAGGYSVPNEMMRAYTEIQKWFGAVRSSATIIQTDSGATLPWPTVDDTANTGEIVSEGGAVTTTADPLFGIVNLGAYKFGSKAVIVPVELLQDSFIQLPTYLGKALGTRIGRIQNTKFTVGTGTGEPNGIANAASLGKTATATNAFTFDEVIDLIHSVDPAYRPRAGFMIHDTIVAYARKLKDSQNRYLWEMSTQVGVPDRMLGYPVAVNNDMDSALTTAKKLLLFGELGQYLVRDAGPLVILRADELRILNHQSVFVCFQRSDGNLPATTAIRYLKLA